jgi:hypothetical protein
VDGTRGAAELVGEVSAGPSGHGARGGEGETREVCGLVADAQAA